MSAFAAHIAANLASTFARWATAGKSLIRPAGGLILLLDADIGVQGG
jgi:hypothetical protein